MKVFLCLILLLILSNCGESSKKINSLSKTISSTLLEWNLKNDVFVKESESEINIKIYYFNSDPKQEDYYRDDLTNGIITKVLCYQHKEYLSKFKVVNFLVCFDSVDFEFTYVFNKEKINLIIDAFDSSPDFYNDIVYCLKTFNYSKMAIMRRITKDIYFEYEGTYDINGFWKVLENISFYHEKYNLGSIKEYKYFLRLAGTLKFQSENYNINTDIYESMKVILKKYEIDEDVLFMKSEDLDTYLINECNANHL